MFSTSAAEPVTAISRGSSIRSFRYFVKWGLVSIVTSFASGASRSRIGFVNVPTPGPYSTNSLVFAQSTGPSILSISTRLDGMIEPTITGFLMKPRRNCQCGLGDRRSRLRWSRRGLFSVRAEEGGMNAPLRGQSRPVRWQMRLRLARFPNVTSDRALRHASANRTIIATKRFLIAVTLRMQSRGFDRAQSRRRRDRAGSGSFPAALCGDARRCGWQYGAAVGDAGDRPRDRDQGFLRRHRLHLVGGAVGVGRALLGGEERPQRPQDADHHGRQRLRGVDGPVRNRIVQRTPSLDWRRADLQHLCRVPDDLR